MLKWNVDRDCSFWSLCTKRFDFGECFDSDLNQDKLFYLWHSARCSINCKSKKLKIKLHLQFVSAIEVCELKIIDSFLFLFIKRYRFVAFCGCSFRDIFFSKILRNFFSYHLRTMKSQQIKQINILFLKTNVNIYIRQW